MRTYPWRSLYAFQFDTLIVKCALYPYNFIPTPLCLNVHNPYNLIPTPLCLNAYNPYNLIPTPLYYII